MSDLLSGIPPFGSGGNGRSQNGTSGPLQGPTPAYAQNARQGMRTPTQIMEARAAREAEKKRQQEELLRQQEQGNFAGVVVEPSMTRRPGGASSAGQSQRPPDQSQSVTIGGRRPENVPPSVQQGGGGYPRPGEAGPSTYGQQAPYSGNDQGATSSRPRRRPTSSTNPIPNLASESGPQQSQTGQPSGQQGARSAFPHAFERWEQLSSHWEGLTSYWIRRLQQNTEELSSKPIDQQMSRQITDLSAAGANLFHAVVELQRLRASSERKFQRWFFETREEQERAREKYAELERQLLSEREERNNYDSSIGTHQTERIKAEELAREMRRELQISKEEARRAWEELGRREQEERERTIALRSGEATLIGGVHVVPMQGIPSRQTSAAQRPTTRDRSYSGGAGRTTMGATQTNQAPSRSQTTTTTLDSPENEQQQFNYQPRGNSPTETDPFTESGRQLRHEPDTQFYTTPQRPTQPATSSAAIAAARAATSATSPSQGYSSVSNGGSQRFYQQSNPETSILSPIQSQTTNQPQPRSLRSGTAGSDQRSYIPSSISGNSEDDWEMNPDGSYILDAQNRRIPRGSSPGGGQVPYPEDDQEDDDNEYNVSSAREREQQHRQRYGGGQSQLQTPNTTGPSSSFAQVTTTQPDYSGAAHGPADPAAAGWTGWENMPQPTHSHPTRLSDIPEERTNPSRASGSWHGQEMPTTTYGGQTYGPASTRGR